MSKKSFSIAAILIAFAAVAFGQRTAVDNRKIAAFGQAIEAGDLARIDGPLLQFALANPNDASIVGLLGELRLKQGRINEALSLLRRSTQLDPSLVPSAVNYAKALLISGERPKAIELLASIRSSQIKVPGVRLNLAEAYMIGEDCEASLLALDGLPPAIKNTDALPIYGVCYSKLGQADKFDALLPIARAAVARRPQAATRFAEVLLSVGRFAQAADLLKAVVKTSPRDPASLLLLGKAEIGAKDLVAARTHLEQARLIEPSSPRILLTMADLEIASGNTAAAVDLCKKAAILDPNSVEVLLQLALTAIKASQARLAVDTAEKILSLQPENAEALYFLGAASLQGGDLDRAEETLRRFTERRPDDSRGCLALGLTLAAETGKVDPARAQLRKCLEIDPRNVEAKYQLGLSYKAQGDTAKAIELFEQVVVAAPKYAAALRDLGSVYLQSGDDVKAREMLERAVAVDPADADTHFQLSRLYNLIGETELAKRQLELFQKLKVGSTKSM